MVMEIWAQPVTLPIFTEVIFSCLSFVSHIYGSGKLSILEFPNMFQIPIIDGWMQMKAYFKINVKERMC